MSSTPTPGLMLDTAGRRNNRKIPDAVCPECSTSFRARHSRSKYCSRACAWRNNGQDSKSGQTWWKSSRGYINGRVLCDGVWVHVKKHRWAMENHLGRKLLPSEDVHHKNGVKDDNRIENLEVVDHSKHATITNATRQYTSGYKLNLTPEDRAARAQRMREMRRAALAKAEGGA